MYILLMYKNAYLILCTSFSSSVYCLSTRRVRRYDPSFLFSLEKPLDSLSRFCFSLFTFLALHSALFPSAYNTHIINIVYKTTNIKCTVVNIRMNMISPWELPISICRNIYDLTLYNNTLYIIYL